MAEREEFEVYAVRYARVDVRQPHECFIMPDPHDGPAPLDYFVWAAVGPEHTYVIDTGFDKASAEARGREFMRAPDAALELIGVKPDAVKDVVITHLHYDHAGNCGRFPNARLHLQDKEMHYATGRCMAHEPLRMPFELDHVLDMVRASHAGRVAFHDGDAELSPGFSVHFVGGHTQGLQFVRVWTRRGWVVLASDASHYYANMERPMPFPIVYNVADMLEGHKRLYELAESPAHVVPGHDPLVMERYPAPTPELEGIAVRLDVEPRS